MPSNMNVKYMFRREKFWWHLGAGILLPHRSCYAPFLIWHLPAFFPPTQESPTIVCVRTNSTCVLCVPIHTVATLLFLSGSFFQQLFLRQVEDKGLWRGQTVDKKCELSLAEFYLAGVPWLTYVVKCVCWFVCIRFFVFESTCQKCYSNLFYVNNAHWSAFMYMYHCSPWRVKKSRGKKYVKK